MKTNAILLLALTLIPSFAAADSPCEFDLPTQNENFLINIPGVGIQRTGVQLPLTGGFDVGDATQYSIYNFQNGQPCDCSGRPTNCAGAHYTYTVVSIPTSFEYQITLLYTDPNTGMPSAFPTKLTKDHINAYYDEKYAGYEPVGDVDFSTNCHGYTFGTGNWPQDGMNGIDVLLSITCYLYASAETADVAYSYAHSMRVGGENCAIEMGYSPQIVFTAEKFRASRVYKQTSVACWDPVNPYQAHIDAQFSLELRQQVPAAQ